jgi:predicted transcriptional regulator
MNAVEEKTFTLTLPDALYQRVQRQAEASQRSVEQLMLESLELLFDEADMTLNVDTALAAMDNYTDAQLWAVVYRRLSWEQSLRLRELIGKAKIAAVSAEEERELDHLLALNDQYMLLRSEALLQLKQRGQAIDAYHAARRRWVSVGWHPPT